MDKRLVKRHQRQALRAGGSMAGLRNKLRATCSVRSIRHAGPPVERLARSGAVS